jgi:hypothetical protein
VNIAVVHDPEADLLFLPPAVPARRKNAFRQAESQIGKHVVFTAVENPCDSVPGEFVSVASVIGQPKRPPNKLAAQALLDGPHSDADKAYFAPCQPGSECPPEYTIGQAECCRAVVRQHPGFGHHDQIRVSQTFDHFCPIHQLARYASKQNAKHIRQAARANPGEVLEGHRQRSEIVSMERIAGVKRDGAELSIVQSFARIVKNCLQGALVAKILYAKDPKEGDLRSGLRPADNLFRVTTSRGAYSI